MRSRPPWPPPPAGPRKNRKTARSPCSFFRSASSRTVFPAWQRAGPCKQRNTLSDLYDTRFSRTVHDTSLSYRYDFSIAVQINSKNCADRPLCNLLSNLLSINSIEMTGKTHGDLKSSCTIVAIRISGWVRFFKSRVVYLYSKKFLRATKYSNTY